MHSVKVETKSSEGERYPYGGLQVKAELRPKSHDGAVVPGKVKDHGDGKWRTIEMVRGSIRYMSITFDPHMFRY